MQQKAAAQTDLDNWRFQRDAYRAAMLNYQAAVRLAQLNLEYTRVTAPFDGRIDRRLKDPGNLVGAGEFTLLAEINQIDPIYVYFTMSESDLLRVMAKSGRSPLESEKIKVPLYLGLANEEGYPRQGYLDFAAISLAPHHRHLATPRHLPESGWQNPAGLVCSPPGRRGGQAQR